MIILSVWDYTVLSVLWVKFQIIVIIKKKFEYLVKFILMKILMNLSKMEVCAQSIQNLWLRPLKSGYFRVALTLRRIFSATKSYLIIDSFFLNYDKLQTLSSTIFEGIVEGLIMIYERMMSNKFHINNWFFHWNAFKMRRDSVIPDRRYAIKWFA
jgi:hypothetical protein